MQVKIYRLGFTLLNCIVFPTSQLVKLAESWTQSGLSHTSNGW